MAWEITIGDKSILLDDLSENDFVDATKDFEDVTWLRLYVSPGAHPGAFYKLLCACALKLGVPAPDKPKTIVDSVKLLQHVKQVEDDLPKAFSEGGLPLATKETVEPPTRTSSTSTGPGSGIQKEPARPR